MNANRANQQSISARAGAALIGSAAIAVAIGVLGATAAHDNGPNQTAFAHPSGGHTVTVEPHVVPPTVTVTRPSSSPPTPFAAPPVRAPQTGAV
jgi:methylmalonyl-CoA mutase cobalamin-binding subunit